MSIPSSIPHNKGIPSVFKMEYLTNPPFLAVFRIHYSTVFQKSWNTRENGRNAEYSSSPSLYNNIIGYIYLYIYPLLLIFLEKEFGILILEVK